MLLFFCPKAKGRQQRGQQSGCPAHDAAQEQQADDHGEKENKGTDVEDGGEGAFYAGGEGGGKAHGLKMGVGGPGGWSGGGVEEVLSQAAPGAVVIAGNGLESILDSQPNPKQAFRLMYYTDAPAFSVRNAEISAEAAVSEVMQRSKRTLDELQVLVMGYGLFAKAICWRLTALGARVWVLPFQLEGAALLATTVPSPKDS